MKGQPARRNAQWICMYADETLCVRSSPMRSWTPRELRVEPGQGVSEWRSSTSAREARNALGNVLCEGDKALWVAEDDVLELVE